MNPLNTTSVPIFRQLGTAGAGMITIAVELLSRVTGRHQKVMYC